jgi:hypothetical protein
VAAGASGSCSARAASPPAAVPRLHTLTAGQRWAGQVKHKASVMPIWRQRKSRSHQLHACNGALPNACCPTANRPRHPPLPSREAVASSWESGDQCRPHAMRVCALMRPTSLKGGPLGATALPPEAAAGAAACCRSNTATVRSRLAEARNLPSGLKTSWVTAAAAMYRGLGQVRHMQSLAAWQESRGTSANAKCVCCQCPSLQNHTVHQTLPVNVWAASWAVPVHLAVSHSQMVAVSADWARQAEAINWPRGSAGIQAGSGAGKAQS